MAREWIKSIQVSVNSEHKRTKGIVAREEAREEPFLHALIPL